ncbi:MAG: hypothetical protein AMXMBFR13_13540 [Phycisphaerae bacterium]
MRPRNVFILLILVLAGTIALSMYVGTCGVSFLTAWQELSLPRLAIGMLAGASLAVAGAMFQSLFRNPLASPSTVGVAGGASLGAAIAITYSQTGLWYGIPVVTLAALLGALACVVLIYGVATLGPRHSMGTLLLAGITIGFICSAMIVLLMFLAGEYDSNRILRWLMGSLQIVGPDAVYEAVAVLALAGGVAAYLHRDLDLLMMGETMAAGRGVAVRRSRRMIYFSASLLTAGIVAQCGPIGFVGLLVPHIMRSLIGATHRHLLPACVLGGAAFLPLCDVLTRNSLWWLQGESREVPVGVLTSLIGGGFFLYLLISRRSSQTAL